MKKSFLMKLSFLSVLFSFGGWILSGPSQAYGPIAVDANGAPMKFQTLNSATPLKWNSETGPIQDTSGPSDASSCNAGGGGGGGCSLNPFLRESLAAVSSNQEGIDLVNQAFNAWKTAATDADVSFAQGSSLGVDVNVCNYTQYIDSTVEPISSQSDPRICGCFNPKPSGCTSECLNPVVFDPAGDIIAAEEGPGNRAAILGSAGPTIWPGVPGFLRFEGIFNGVCLSDNPDTNACGSFTISTEDMLTVMIHEFGHAMGLNHVQVNPDSVIVSCPGGACSATLKPSANQDDVPTMYPLLVTGGKQSTPHKDDITGLAHLYPKSTLNSNYCTANGTIFKGTNGLRCAEVVLRESGNATMGAISFISGAEVKNNSIPNVSVNACAESSTINCGNYSIQGMVPGKTYQIEINPINSNFTGGSRVGPCDPPNSQVSHVGPIGSITCPAGGTVITCSGGATNDTDLCQTIP